MAEALGIYPRDAEETRLARLYEAIKRAVLNGQPLQGRGGYVGDGVLTSTSKETAKSAVPRGLGRVERDDGSSEQWRGHMGFSVWQIKQVLGEVPSDEPLLRRLWLEAEVRRLILDGLSQREIAAELPISQATVHRIAAELRRRREV
jgi:ATP/maltotriose-dependent transcriptional regulator MalT